MMEHPQHGRHPATPQEIEYLKSQGWTVRAPKVAPAEPAQEPAPAASEAPLQKRKYVRKAVKGA